MQTSHRRSMGRIAALAVLSTGLVSGMVGGPAAAAPKPQADYVALGDSYAAGFGAGSYLNSCGQSPFGLPSLLDETIQVELTADASCSGAKAADNPADAVPDLPEQLADLQDSGAIGEQTDLITVSAGGNDVNFGAVVAACATQPLATCQQVIDSMEIRAQTTLAASLDALYGNLRSAAPNATIVVTGYPFLFTPDFGSEVLLSTEAQRLFNDGTDGLNAVIEQNAEANGLEYVDVVQRFRFHGIGAPSPWITFTGFTSIDDLHPNAKGYKTAYLPSLRNEVSLSSLRR